MSASAAMDTRVSFGVMQIPLGFPIQIRQPLLEVQSRADAFERQAQLHHRKRHLGLDADDDCFGAAQSQHVATARSVRVAKESMTSRTVTSTMTPRERYFPTRSERSSRSRNKSASDKTD